MNGRNAKLLRRCARSVIHPSDLQPRGLEPIRNDQGKPKRGSVVMLTRVVGVNTDGTSKEVEVPFEITPTLVNRGLSERGVYRWLKRDQRVTA